MLVIEVKSALCKSSKVGESAKCREESNGRGNQ